MFGGFTSHLAQPQCHHKLSTSDANFRFWCDGLSYEHKRLKNGIKEIGKMFHLNFWSMQSSFFDTSEQKMSLTFAQHLKVTYQPGKTSNIRYPRSLAKTYGFALRSKIFPFWYVYCVNRKTFQPGQWRYLPTFRKPEWKGYCLTFIKKEQYGHLHLHKQYSFRSSFIFHCF